MSPRTKIVWMLLTGALTVIRAVAQAAAPLAEDASAADASVTAESAPVQPAAPVAPRVDTEALRRTAEMGTHAYETGLYDMAEGLFREYWAGAYTEDDLIDAADRLIKSLVAQQKIEGARQIINAVPNRVTGLLGRHEDAAGPKLSTETRTVLAYWDGRLVFLAGDEAAALPKLERVASLTLSEQRRIDVLLDIAYCHVAAEDWTDAVSAFESVLDLNTGEEAGNKARLGLVRTLIRQGKYPRANGAIMAHWMVATGVYRHKLGMLKIVGLIELGLADEAHRFFQNNFENTMDFTVDDEDYPILRALGLRLIEADMPKVAEKLFERMLSLFSGDARMTELLLDIVDAREAANDIEGAIQKSMVFLEIYTQDARNPLIRFRVARFHLQLADSANASLFFGQVLNDADAPVEQRYQSAESIAWIQRDNKEYDAAIDTFLRASRLEGSDELKATAEFFAAEIYRETERFTVAATYYNSVAAKYAGNSHAEEARYKQGLCRYEAKLFRQAAADLGNFLLEWPQSKRFSKDAILQKGIAHSKIDEHELAIAEFVEFQRRFPADDEATYAMLKASEASQKLDRLNDGIDYLSVIIEQYRESQRYPYALYRRAYLRLANGDYQRAVADGDRFLREWGESRRDLAPHMLLWLGDHHATIREPEQAEHYFIELVQEYAESPHAPEALYEAAKNAYRQEAFKKALGYVDRIFQDYKKAPDRVLAKAYFLRGDIKSFLGEFETAADAFGKCADLVPETNQYFAALGRLGDCHYSMASLKKQKKLAAADFDRALNIYGRIKASIDINPHLIEKARYRFGKIHEKQGNIEMAMGEYSYIVVAYSLAKRQGQGFEWYYFARAGSDLVRLCREREEYSRAISILRILCDSNFPMNADFCTQLQELERRIMGSDR